MHFLHQSESMDSLLAWSPFECERNKYAQWYYLSTDVKQRQLQPMLFDLTVLDRTFRRLEGNQSTECEKGPAVTTSRYRDKNARPESSFESESMDTQLARSPFKCLKNKYAQRSCLSTTEKQRKLQPTLWERTFRWLAGNQSTECEKGPAVTTRGYRAKNARPESSIEFESMNTLLAWSSMECDRNKYAERYCLSTTERQHKLQPTLLERTFSRLEGNQSTECEKGLVVTTSGCRAKNALPESSIESESMDTQLARSPFECLKNKYSQLSCLSTTEKQHKLQPMLLERTFRRLEGNQSTECEKGLAVTTSGCRAKNALPESSIESESMDTQLARSPFECLKNKYSQLSCLSTTEKQHKLQPMLLERTFRRLEGNQSTECEKGLAVTTSGCRAKNALPESSIESESMDTQLARSPFKCLKNKYAQRSCLSTTEKQRKLQPTLWERTFRWLAGNQSTECEKGSAVMTSWYRAENALPESLIECESMDTRSTECEKELAQTSYGYRALNACPDSAIEVFGKKLQNKNCEKADYKVKISKEYKTFEREFIALRVDSVRMLICSGDRKTDNEWILIADRVQKYLSGVREFFDSKISHINSMEFTWTLRSRTLALEALNKLYISDVSRMDDFIETVVEM